MRIFIDKLTGDEVGSDAFKKVEINEFLFKLEGALITVGGDDDFDIGANPSAEDGGDAGVDASDKVQVVNVVHSCELQETSFDKKSLQVYFKDFFKKMAEHVPADKMDGFKAAATAFAKEVLGNLKDWQFFTGKNMDPDGLTLFLNYDKETDAPYLVYFTHAIKEEKV
ncbi:translationally controlled tumor protein [Ramicandelaber brevisporus]|nr:translationally controlled tumor protein [Ramicandelaber brevisporus]